MSFPKVFDRLRLPLLDKIKLDNAEDDVDWLVNQLPNDIDVVCFQEMFNEEAWSVMNDKLEQAGYRYFLFDPHTPLFKSHSFHFFPIGKFFNYLRIIETNMLPWTKYID